MTGRRPIPTIRQDGLQLDEHRRFQERYWRVQRVAWLGFGTALVLALLGFTGSGGPFHSQRIVFPDAVAEMPRVSRWDTADEMTITFTTADTRRKVTIGASFFDGFAVDEVRPAPAGSALGPAGQTLWFDVDDPRPPHRITLPLRAAHVGWRRFDLTLNGEVRSVRLLVLP